MIYYDSNFFIYAAIDGGKTGQWARKLLNSIESGKESAVTSALTYDEFFGRSSVKKDSRPH